MKVPENVFEIQKCIKKLSLGGLNVNLVPSIAVNSESTTEKIFVCISWPSKIRGSLWLNKYPVIKYSFLCLQNFQFLYSPMHSIKFTCQSKYTLLFRKFEADNY